MNKAIIIIFLFLSKGINAQVTGNWKISMAAFSDLDYAATSVLSLKATDGSVHAAKANDGANPGSYDISEIKITPPTGKENAWLALLLFGISTGGELTVYGTGSAGVITANNFTASSSKFSVSK